MASNKFLFIIFVLLVFGIFGQQRFQRHLFNDTQNELNLDMAEFNGYEHDSRGELASDDFTLPKEGESIEVELLNGVMSFEMCSYGCDFVTLCFDSDIPSSLGGCDSNQCGFQARLSRLGNIVYAFFNTKFRQVRLQCGIVTMKFPEITFFNLVDSSCYPKRYYDRNVVKLYVKEAASLCSFLKIIGAREWIPPTSSAAAISSPNPTSNAEESSISEETMWIIIAVVVVLLVIILACAGFWGYRYWKQKKSVTKSSDAKNKEPVPDKKIIETTIVKQENAIEETVETKTTKDETVEEKKEIITQPKPKKTNIIKLQKYDRKVVAKTPKKKTVKLIHEETPSNEKTIKPVVEDTNTNQSSIQNVSSMSVSKKPSHFSKIYDNTNKCNSQSSKMELN